uniref:Cysteinyl-tRNA ligase anticodon binding domain-containing protein n=1 Tax=Coccolithus braarudii TaxID=221442 RepID=A0A7S0PYQ2_9EUKA|mmetsp:Transcript_23255/g.50152  ORF Transcript_23255/g.50152 Transcript_23255/m.50152 type:complete len:374 (+) Transcript_23255:133-1254(+)
MLKRKASELLAIPTTDEIRALLAQRAEARASKDWQTADNIKEDLRNRGVQVHEERGAWGGTFRTRDGRCGSFSTDSAGALTMDVSLGTEVIISELERRHTARKDRDWNTADNIKNYLKANGVLVLDKEGIWKTNDGREGLFGDAALANPSMLTAPQSGIPPTMLLPVSHTITGIGGLQSMGQFASIGQTVAPIGGRAAEINRVLAVREQARKQKDWTTADSIKSQLRADGVDVDDRKGEWTTADGYSGRSDGTGTFAKLAEPSTGSPMVMLGQSNCTPMFAAQTTPSLGEEKLPAVVERDWALLRAFKQSSNPGSVLQMLRSQGYLNEETSTWTEQRVQEQHAFLCQSIRTAACMVGTVDPMGKMRELVGLCM